MASSGQFKGSKSRKGRRPMRVDTMIRKEKEGTLYKYTGHVKTAEPPPPKGVSVQEWDKILQGKKKEAQDSDKNKDGFRLQGRENFQGLPIAIENAKGSVRKGTNEDGSSWRTKFRTPYGYIEGTKGADGDEIDAYVGPDSKAPKAFVVHQKKKDGSHDEDTVMLGFRSAAAAKKDILRHYDDPSQLGGITPILVEKLRKKVMPGKKIEKLSADFGSEQSRLEYREGDAPHMTGFVYKSKRKKGDVPTRGDTVGGTTSESRQEGSGVVPAAAFRQVEGYHDTGKTASVGKLATAPKTNFNLETVYPSREADTYKAYPRHLEKPHKFDDVLGVQINDLGVVEKSASMAGFVEELAALDMVLTPGQLEKIADVTKGEAEAALKRLRKLEASKPSGAEVARGALVGGGVGPAANLAWRAAAGPEARMGRPIVLKTPKGRIAIRPQIATAAHGAVFGSMLPAGRHRLEREAEKQKLREYVGGHRRGTLRGKIKKVTGL